MSKSTPEAVTYQDYVKQGDIFLKLFNDNGTHHQEALECYRQAIELVRTSTAGVRERRGCIFN